MGRSAGIAPEDVSGEVASQALGALLEHLGKPATLLVHSMSGPYGFRTVESHGDLVQAMVAVAPGPPGNIQPVPRVLREDDAEVEIATPSVNLVIAKGGAWRPTVEFARLKLVGSSEQFAADDLPALLASTSPIPVPYLLGRLNLGGSQLVIERADPFAGKPVLVLTGSHDADHPREADGATADWLRGLGANVDYHYLLDLGISGNGHMLMSERNSAEIAAHIADWLTERAGAGD